MISEIKYALFFLLFLLPAIVGAQVIQDDFEGNGNITAWVGDNCGANPNFSNPFQQTINTSNTVLRYQDTGGQFANIRFQRNEKFDLTYSSVFTLKVYVPSNGLTGNQPNQVSIKLQNGLLNEPWTTQTEIIKSIALDQWQTLTFDFAKDPFHNLDGGSGNPRYRTDFDRVLIQVNGENNNDQVIAYFDDFFYETIIPNDPVFDQLVWSDEFNNDGSIDNVKWFHQTQLPNGYSWFNDEQQHYTNRLDNSFVDNGMLKIVAKKESFADQGFVKDYTSARLNSKFAFQYGKVEVRAKLPIGSGTWPAIWMLGKNINETGAYWKIQGFGTTSWPECGEIDIMEHWGRNQNFIQSAMHTPSSYGDTQNKGGRTIPTVSNDFHIYTLEWSAEKMVFKVDDVIHYIYDPVNKNSQTWPFDAEQYLLLNVAIESVIDPNFTESTLEIDYVRVFQENTVSTISVEENSITKFYPNPVVSELNISLPGMEGAKVGVEIFSTSGSLIKSSNCLVIEETATIRNLNTLVAGVYLAVYQLEGKNYILKFVKE